MLVSKICVTPNPNPKICVTPNAYPPCKSVEYRCVGACIGHVHFMLFVSILFALGTQHKRIFSGIWAIIAWLVRTLSYYGLLVLLGHVGYFDTSAMHLD